MDGAGQEPESEQEEDEEEVPALKEENCFFTLSEPHSGHLGADSSNRLCK